MENHITTAIQKGYFHQVRFLVKLGLDVNEGNDKGRTPLMLCSVVENDQWAVGLARTLLDGGAHTSRSDRLGRTVIHYVCVRKRSNLLRVLLAAIDHDVNKVDRSGNTALHYAAATGETNTTRQVLNACLRYGCRVDVINNDGLTPLMVAFKEQHLDCVTLIREATRELTERDDKRKELENVRIAEAAKAAKQGIHAATRFNVQHLEKRITFKMDSDHNSKRNELKQDRHLLRRSGVDLCNGWVTDIESTNDLSRRLSLGPHVNSCVHQRQQRASFSHPIQWKYTNIVSEGGTILVNSHQPDSVLESVNDSEKSENTNHRSSIHFHSITATSAREQRVSSGAMSGGRSSQISVTMSSGRSLKSARSGVMVDQTQHDCSRHEAHHGHTHKSISLSFRPVADIVELKMISMISTQHPRNNSNKLVAYMNSQRQLFKPSYKYSTGIDGDHSVCNQRSGKTVEEVGNIPWRASLNTMYESYGYQFTSSFCRPVKPRIQRSITSTAVSELDVDSTITPDCDAVGSSRRLHSGRRPSARRRSSVRLGLDTTSGRGTRKNSNYDKA